MDMQTLLLTVVQRGVFLGRVELVQPSVFEHTTWPCKFRLFLGRRTLYMVTIAHCE